MSEDRHRFILEVDDGWVCLRVECPYDKADESRPCWPCHEEWPDGGEAVMVSDAAPIDFCNYEAYVENLSLDEIIRGSASLKLPGAWFDWTQGPFEPVVNLHPM